MQKMAGLEEALIIAYRNYPILYDFADKNYKNEQIKLNAWSKIAEDLQVMGFNHRGRCLFLSFWRSNLQSESLLILIVI